jgi:hypothetical protein
MRKFSRLLLGPAALFLASCAPPAAQVPPIFIQPPLDYGRTCERLAAKRARLTERVIFASLRQDSLYRADRERTLGIPTPLGTPFEENRELELGLLKGELVQINERIRESRCNPS